MVDRSTVTSLSVLVVDDEEPIRRNFKAYLEDLGHRVALASDGEEALEVFARVHPDIVLTDLRMPGMGGLSLVSTLHEVSPVTPLIVISGTGDIRDAVTAIRAGAWDYVLKPVEQSLELDLAIARNVDRAHLLSATRQNQARLEELVAERTAELREREKRLSIVADNTYDWEWWMAPDGQFLYCSPSYERVTGYAREQLVEDPLLLGRIIHADDRERMQAQVGADGGGAPGTIEFRIVHRDGTLRWIDLVYQPVFDDDGTFLGNRGVSRDITERKRLETQVLRMQRQESLGRLASGIAHDLNNVLAPIMMAGDLLQTASLNENERECVEMVRASSARGADMVKQLLLFSRGVDGRRANIDPARIVREVAHMASETFPKDIQFRLDLPDEAWLVEADQTQLHQVVLNLCVNARDAMPNGGRLAMALERVDVDESSAALQTTLKEGPYVVLVVADTGTGIAPEVIEKIFDPFFTTKPHGEGTGLGLSTVQGIVTSHGGVVDVQSELGRGTAVRVYLPRARSEEADVADESRAMEVPHGGGQTVLVVDDEKMVRSLIKRSLQSAGYQVLLAEGGVQAIELLGRADPRVELALVDMWMPQMDGVSTIRRLTRLDPTVRVIAMSGLSEAREPALCVGPAVKRFLLKPWRTKDLLTAVHEVLTAQNEGDVL